MPFDCRPAVLILAGGKSTRMGSDKALAEIEGRTLLQRAADFWRQALPDSPIYISVGQSTHFSTLPEGTIPIADRYPGSGPMAGLQAAFLETGAELLAVSAVDMPLLSYEAFNMLRTQLRGDEDLCVFERDGFPEPLFGFYRRSCLARLEQMLSAGNLRMVQLIKTSRANLVPLSAETAASVTNTNTPEELQRARVQLKTEHKM